MKENKEKLQSLHNSPYRMWNLHQKDSNLSCTVLSQKALGRIKNPSEKILKHLLLLLMPSQIWKGRLPNTKLSLEKGLTSLKICSKRPLQGGANTKHKKKKSLTLSLLLQALRYLIYFQAS